METQSLAKNLVYQRKLKGYTQEALADRATVTIRTIQRIEKGDVNPHLQTVKLLANALDIEVNELLVLANPKEETIQKKWLLLIHSSPILGFVFPFTILFPLFLWIHKREDNPLYHQEGIKVINFQISIWIIFLLAFVALLSIEGWGVLFFLVVIPFSILTSMFNVFRLVNSQTTYYPLSYPFLKGNRKSTNVKTMLLVLLGFSFLMNACAPQNKNANKAHTMTKNESYITYKCTPCDLDCDTLLFKEAGICPHCKMKLLIIPSMQKKSSYKELKDYEGKYQYIGTQTMNLIVSELDSTLYIVIDKVYKYPLKQVALDSFVNVQNELIIFHRDRENNVIHIEAEGTNFKLITKDFKRVAMLPRKELFHQPENYVYQQPVAMQDGLATGDLKIAFKNPEAILEMVRASIKGTYTDVHSILIYKNNQLVLEEYFYDYDQDTPHQLRSATKSFIGTLVGIAVDKKLFSEQDKLLPFFISKYGKIENVDQKKENLIIADFLKYQHGMDCDNNNPASAGNELTMMESEDWVKFTMDLPMIQEGGKSSVYCTGCALSLGTLVEIASKEKLEVFAKNNLFTPMGISHYNWRFDPDPSSKNTFSQMSIRPRDLVKLAKMYMDDGQWNGQQILSKTWVAKTFDTQDGDYGYLWKHKYFTINGQRYDSYMATGNGGQKINIWPALDMITVFTGGNYNSYALYGKSTPPNEMIPKYILEAL